MILLINFDKLYIIPNEKPYKKDFSAYNKRKNLPKKYIKITNSNLKI